jgi:hypothetical protein
MIEPTITQNNALYFAQHRPRKPRPFFGACLTAAARKDRIVVKQQRAFENIFLWRFLHPADKR